MFSFDFDVDQKFVNHNPELYPMDFFSGFAIDLDKAIRIVREECEKYRKEIIENTREYFSNDHTMDAMNNLCIAYSKAVECFKKSSPYKEGDPLRHPPMIIYDWRIDTYLFLFKAENNGNTYIIGPENLTHPSGGTELLKGW